MISFTLNGRPHQVELEGDMPLLWYLRDELKMTGTKFGCGVASCGACTVHVDGVAARACQIYLGDLEGAVITSIEGNATPAAKAVEDAWVEMQVAQCGYCQSGQIMSATALLTETPKPTDDDIDAALGGNLCRCATYARIRRAVHRAAELMEA